MIAEMVTAVQAYFDAQGVVAKVVGDFPERDKQINQGAGGAARVVIYYGDPDSGDCGPLTAPRGQSNAADENEPRRLAGDEVLITLFIWGVDSTQPTNRAAQVDAARALRDWTIRAFVACSQGTGDLEWGSTRRTKDVERQFGVELRVDLTIRMHVDDTTNTVVFPTSATPTPNPPLS